MNIILLFLHALWNYFKKKNWIKKWHNLDTRVFILLTLSKMLVIFNYFSSWTIVLCTHVYIDNDFSVLVVDKMYWFCFKQSSLICKFVAGTEHCVYTYYLLMFVQLKVGLVQNSLLTLFSKNSACYFLACFPII